MKIKDILRRLLSGEDFSDHSTGKEDGHAPLHGTDCDFCTAWSAALDHLSMRSMPEQWFDAGEKVALPGGIRGRVMATDVTVRVEVQRGEHGPWAVGTFRPIDLKPWREVEPEFTSWRTWHGDVWEREESTLKMRRTSRTTGTWKPGEKLPAWEDVTIHFAHVENIVGDLERIS